MTEVIVVLREKLYRISRDEFNTQKSLFRVVYKQLF